MNIGELGWALSRPQNDETAQRAAQAVLEGTDPLNFPPKLYRVLLMHKCFRHAMKHLEEGGVDLGKTFVSTETIRNTFPLSRKPLWAIPQAPRCSLRHFVASMNQHQELLWDETAKFSQLFGSDRFVLLSGKALQSLFPHYQDRLGFDTDLWVPTVSDGLDALAVLVNELGFTLKFARLHNVGSEPSLGASAIKNIDGYGVSLGILAGSYQLYAEPLDERAIQTQRSGLPFLAPSLEDLLLMVVSKVQRRRKLLMVNVSDVEVILGAADGPEAIGLDCDRVLGLSRQYGLNVPLSKILAQVNLAWPGRVPDGLATLMNQVSAPRVAITSRALRNPEQKFARTWENRGFRTSGYLQYLKLHGWLALADVLLLRTVGMRSLRRMIKNMDSKRGRLLPFLYKIFGVLPLCAGAEPTERGNPRTCLGESSEMPKRGYLPKYICDTADGIFPLIHKDDHDCLAFVVQR